MSQLQMYPLLSNILSYNEANLLDFLLSATSCQVVYSDSQEHIEQNVWLRN